MSHIELDWKDDGELGLAQQRAAEHVSDFFSRMIASWKDDGAFRLDKEELGLLIESLKLLHGGMVERITA